MIKYIILFTALYCLNLNAQVNIQKSKDALIQTEKSFSELSKQKGVKEAFLAYVADDGVLLRPYTMPIAGYEAVKKFLEEGDSNFELTWIPLHADVSSSGDLGYTYGTFTLKFKDDSGIEQTRMGTYVSIWKLNNEGKWKFVLDTGNPGLEPKK